jgi:integrase
MGKLARELGAMQVSRLTSAGLHFVGRVPGLALQVAPGGSRSWILRVRVAGRRRDMGLGSYPGVTLANAHALASAAREKVRAGVDPIDEAKAKRSASAAARLAAQTFEECAAKFIAAKSSEWKNAKHAAQWSATLATYAYPLIGRLLVSDIDLPQVLAVLEPIWKTKTETATRLRGRMEAVLDWATVKKYRTGLNPARWRGHLDKILPAPAKVAKVEHHAALDMSAVAGFMSAIRSQAGMGALALEFLVLTAARSGEVRGATWAEMDEGAGTWTIPGERMKAGKEHKVPLSKAALAVLRRVPRMAGVDLVFPAPRGGLLSDMTLTAVMRRMGADAVPHGFRSTFRDWASERTSYPRDVAEMALAHTIGDKVEAAYRRGDLFEKRRRMMNDWAAFCAKVAPASVEVVLLRKARA